MSFTNDEYFELENLVTLVFNIGIFVFHFMPPYSFCHGNGHGIVTCTYHSTWLLITTSLPTFVESSFLVFPQVPIHNISQSQPVS